MQRWLLPNLPECSRAGTTAEAYLRPKAASSGISETAMWHLGKFRLHLHWFIAFTPAAAVLGAAPAQACRMFVQPSLDDVRYADVVVVGRIDNYRIIRDEAFRRRMLASPNLPSDMRKIYEDPRQSLISDYARIDILVEEVLVGRTSDRTSATWSNSTFALPDQIAPGPYLIALRRPSSASPPLRGPSGTIVPSPDPHDLTLLQAPCSSAFIFEIESEQARRLRELVKSRQR